MKLILNISFMVLIFFIEPLYASRVQVIGNGQAFSKPNQIEFTITIQAKCYSTIDEASQSADKLTRHLFDELNKLFPKKDQYNQILTQGGYTLRSEYPRYRDKPNECQNTFQKISTIRVLTNDLGNFETLFNSVQKMVYQDVPPPDENMISRAIVYSTISEPIATLSFDARQKLEFTALDSALKNAIDKATQLVGKSGAASLKIVEMNESLPTPPPPFGPMMMRAAAVESNTGPMAPISFDNEIIQKNLSVIFEY